jgi:NADP-dependent 3-hydroxy acid dehydrogenase YdfG
MGAAAFGLIAVSTPNAYQFSEPRRDGSAVPDGHRRSRSSPCAASGASAAAPYTASKAALRELADSLRAEEARHGLRVTTIYPGGTATELLRKVRGQFGDSFNAAECIQPETLAALVLSTLEVAADAYVAELTVLPAPRAD